MSVQHGFVLIDHLDRGRTLLADGRQHPPLRRPRPVRVLERHAPLDASSGEQTPPPPVPDREPANQPGAAHHGHRAAAQPHRRPRLLRPTQSRREDLDGGHALLRRRLSNVVYQQMPDEHKRKPAAGPGGHSGTTLQSSVTDLTPDIGSSDKPHPGPANPTVNQCSKPPLDTKGSQMRELAAGEGQTRRDGARALRPEHGTTHVPSADFAGSACRTGPPCRLSALGQPCGARAWLVAHSSA